MKALLLISVSIFICSCSTNIDYDNELFKASMFYKNKNYQKTKTLKSKLAKRVTASFKSQTIYDFSIWFANEFKKGVVFEESIKNREISAEFVEATEQEIINLVAKMFEKESNKINNTYHIGSFKQEDRGVLVRYVEGLSVDDTNKILTSVVANQGRYTVTENCVAIVIERESVLTRVSSLLDSLGSVSLKRYVVNYYFVNLNVSELEQKGVDLTTTGDFSAVLSQSSTLLDSVVQPQNLRYIANFNISGFIEYLNQNSFGKLTSTPMFVCFDNVKTLVSTQETVPYPKRIVSPEGTVTTDYESQRVGERLESVVRSAGENKVVLTLDYSNSEIVDFLNNEVPRVKGTEFKTGVILDVDKLYLLGEMITNDDRETKKSFFNSKSKDLSKTQIFVKVIQI